MLDWVVVWTLVLLVAGNVTVATRYSTQEGCEAAGKAWAASTPGGRGYMCLRNEFPIYALPKKTEPDDHQ